jgi:hypothetical protein
MIVVAGALAVVSAEGPRPAADRGKAERTVSSTQPAHDVVDSAPDRPGRPPSFRAPLGGPLAEKPGDPDERDKGYRGGPPGRRPFGSRFRGSDSGPDFGPPPMQEIERIMEVLREEHPKVHEGLIQLRRENQAEFMHQLRRARPIVMEILRRRMEQPERTEMMREARRLDMELSRLRRAYQDAGADSERQRLRPEIRKRLEQRFELRLQHLRLEVRDFEERIRRARQQLTEREQNREAIVDEELERFVTSGELDPPPEPKGWHRRRSGPDLPPGGPDLPPPPTDAPPGGPDEPPPPVDAPRE